MINEGAPDTNYYKKDLKVGVDADGVKRSLIKFNVEQFDESESIYLIFLSGISPSIQRTFEDI